MTRYLVTDQQLRHAIHSSIRALDLSKQDENYTIESTAKVSDKALELLASSKTAESEQTENPKQAAGQDQLAYKCQSNRADILRTLKLKAETQPTFDLAEVNQ